MQRNLLSGVRRVVNIKDKTVIVEDVDALEEQETG
jgi:hypothetical protein